MAKDPYSELGVSRSASQAEVRAAFRKLAKQHHPDANPGDKAAEERFKRVSAAFDILGDVDKRKRFDQGEIDADGRDTHPGFSRQGGFAGGGFGGGGRGGAQFEGVDLNDILGEVFGARSRAGGMGGGFAPPRGEDLRAKLAVDLEDVIQGAKRRITFSDGRTIEVAVPKGASEGQVLRLKGQGGIGRGGAGDALIELSIKPHPLYRREGEALVMDLPISVPDAVLGAKVNAPTPDGTVSLSVPAGSSSGAVLRLKGRGLPGAGGGRGDLLARLMIVLPEAPDPELTGFCETWRAARPYTPKRR